MKFIILTLFPEMIESFFAHSILKRAIESGKIEVQLRNLRDWTADKHKTVDDTPYGGGAGMVLRADIIDRALVDLKAENRNAQVILLTPQGKTFEQELAEALAKKETLILIAGHYEGFDERVRQLVDQEISIGNFVLTGGELPASVIVDAVARLIPDVLGDHVSAQEESFSLKDERGNRLLEYPHYTRPSKFIPKSKEGLGELTVPQILQSGNHEAIKSWRFEQAKLRTSINQRIKGKEQE